MKNQALLSFIIAFDTSNPMPNDVEVSKMFRLIAFGDGFKETRDLISLRCSVATPVKNGVGLMYIESNHVQCDKTDSFTVLITDRKQITAASTIDSITEFGKIAEVDFKLNEWMFMGSACEFGQRWIIPMSKEDQQKLNGSVVLDLDLE